MNISIDIQKLNTANEARLMYELAERLYPICRSITGNGVRETLSIINEFIPIDVSEVPTGTKVLDWEIPDEWNIKDAWIKNSKGEKIVDFNKSNLHVLNYSIPIDKKISFAELKENLYSLPEHPDWIPYRTSYYKRQWGFCISHQQYNEMNDDEYHVKVDSELKPGALTYGEYFIKGKSEKEVLFSCHICHPSLCNDNLSGIVIATILAKILRDLDLEYSYRFLFIPGTIGSITWLALNEQNTAKIKHGIVLTLLGDSSAFHYKKTRQENAEIDQIMTYLLKDEKNSKILEFSPYGYDERQFCSPGFNLPVGRLSRKPFGEFPEYHTSADNLAFINSANLGKSLSLLLKLITIIEGNKKWINLSPKGEPQLGQRGLYSSIGGLNQQGDYQMALLWILNMSDGKSSLLDIALKSGIKFETLLMAADELTNANLLK